MFELATHCSFLPSEACSSFQAPKGHSRGHSFPSDPHMYPLYSQVSKKYLFIKCLWPEGHPIPSLCVQLMPFIVVQARAHWRRLKILGECRTEWRATDFLNAFSTFFSVIKAALYKVRLLLFVFVFKKSNTPTDRVSLFQINFIILPLRVGHLETLLKERIYS